MTSEWALGTVISRDQQTIQWFESYGINVAEDFPHIPNINPIEHVWKAMKYILWMHQRYLKDHKDNAESKVIFIVLLKAL